MEPAQVLVGAQARHVRHPADSPVAQRHDPGRRRSRRGIAELRQHPVCAAGAVLRRPAVVVRHRLARRADAALRPGPAHARCRQEPDVHRRRPHRQTGRRRDGRRGHLGTDAGRRVLRTGCIEVGECMTGCRHNAKNTLVKNYLYLAEKAGAEVYPMTTVTGFGQRADGLWDVHTVRTGSWVRRKKRTFTAQYLVLAAGTFNTQKLLFKMRDKGKLPKLSERLGVLTRTNSESIVGAGRFEVSADLDLTHGVAIT